MPLLIILLDRKAIQMNSNKFAATILGSALGHIISQKYSLFHLSKKMLLILSCLFYFIYLSFPDLYFLLYGFISFQAYNSNVLISKREQISQMIFRIEILGLLVSELIFTLSKIGRYFLGIITLILCLMASRPCIESENPYECLKSQVDSASLINLEYRAILKKENRLRIFDECGFPTLLDVLYFVSKHKIYLLLFLFFNSNLLDLIIFIIGVLYVFGIFWEPLAMFLEIGHSSNTTYRFIVNYLLLIAIELVDIKK